MCIAGIITKNLVENRSNSSYCVVWLCRFPVSNYIYQILAESLKQETKERRKNCTKKIIWQFISFVLPFRIEVGRFNFEPRIEEAFFKEYFKHDGCLLSNQKNKLLKFHLMYVRPRTELFWCLRSGHQKNLRLQ